MVEQLKFSLAVLFVIAAFVFVACEGPAGPAGPPGPAGADGADGAWVLIEAITLTTDTNTVTFDGISDEWEVLEVQAYGSITPDSGEGSTYYASAVNMRLNSDADSSYYQFSSKRDYIGVNSWFTHYFVFNAKIIPDCQDDSIFSVNWNLYGYYPNVGGGSIEYKSALYFNPIEDFINRIDLYFHESDTIARFEPGSEFVLLGLDVD